MMDEIVLEISTPNKYLSRLALRWTGRPGDDSILNLIRIRINFLFYFL